MQFRQESLEGTGEIKLRRLVKEALRMRPSRIIVGEVRQEEGSRLRIAIAEHAAPAGEGLARIDHSRAGTSPHRRPRGQETVRSSRRDVMPSLAKILLRCHSTVRVLMNNCPPISELV
jgi:hypothetical protein